MKCTCGHMPWHHGWATYPKAHQPCEVCERCGRWMQRDCCRMPRRCPCSDYEKEGAA